MCGLMITIIAIIIYFILYLGLMFATGCLTRRYDMYVSNHTINESEDADKATDADSLLNHGKLR